jgi:microsomal dipeptidase-like Zn-dependent dipeptidase
VKLLITLTLFAWFHGLSAMEIHTFMDMQIHPTMNHPFPFFGNGLSWLGKKEPKLSHKHMLNNVIYADYLKQNSGARVLVNGAMAAEVAFTRKQAKRLILKQIKAVNNFAQKHSEHFVVAKTPAEVRYYVNHTNKTVFIHSIEGARKLIRSQADADFWAKQGVAFITLIHLFDDEYGAAAIKPIPLRQMVNPRGVLRGHFHADKRRLTELGKKAIKWIHRAGMLVDLTHMSHYTIEDSLEFMQKNDIPPLVTHGVFRPIQNYDGGFTREQILKIYKMNGLFSLPISGEPTSGFNPEKEFEMLINHANHCEGSIDSYKLTFNSLRSFLNNNVEEVFPLKKSYDELSEEQKTKLSIGWQSDFNGWLNHSRPRFGSEGCYALPNENDVLLVDRVGLAHPGLMPQFWQILKREGLHIESLKRASERFLQIWQSVRN